MKIGTEKSISTRLAALKARLREYGSALVAFSGGVDSSVLLAVAAEVLPRRKLLAVSARSATYPPEELKLARRIARLLRVRHRVIDTGEFDNPSFVANPPRRCYHCKRELFGELRRIAEEEELSVVLDGTNADDTGDYRPGRDAAQECGIQSPLLDAGLNKADLRALARKYGLPNWDKPAAACLASRIPYGTRLDTKLLARIDAAERLLLRAGFTQVRVRHHDRMARVEILPKEFARMMRPAVRALVTDGLKKLGWQYVTLDLSGYRTGSMNVFSVQGPTLDRRKRHDKALSGLALFKVRP